MKRKKKVIFAGILSLLVGLTACGKNNEKSVVAQYDKGQYLNIVLEGEPKTLDQSKSENTYSNQVLLEVNEALTRVEQDSKGKDIVKPAGAEKWEVSNDGLKWTFHLRDNNWSDGRAVTAKDYEYSIKRTLDPKVASKHAFLLYPIKGSKVYSDVENNKDGKIKSDELGIKALDDKTLEITLEEPCAYFLNITSFSVMQPQRKDIVDKYGLKYGNDAETMVFCGPFQIKEWIHNDKIELVKNEGYWDAKSVKLQKATMKIKKTDTAIVDGLLEGSLDEGKVMKMEMRNKVDKTLKFDSTRVSKLSTNYEIYNIKDKLFSNYKIRKAFSLAIDREEVSKSLWKGIYSPAYAYIPTSLQIGEEEFRQEANFEPIKKLKEDNSNPKTLLKEGLKELGMDPDPNKITVRYLQPGADERQKEIAEFFKQMYTNNLGVNIKLEYVEWNEFENKMVSGDYQMATMVWTAEYNDPFEGFNLWMTDANIISNGWSNSKYDRLISRAELLGSDKNEERFNCFKEAESILLLGDVVIAPTVYRNKQIYNCKYVKGVMYPLTGAEIEIKYAYTQGRYE